MPRTWSRPTRVALFTDTLDEVSGVGHTFRLLADHCQARGQPLTIFTVSPADSSIERRGSVTIHRLKPRLALCYYPGLYLDLLPLDETVMACAASEPFDVVHVATPGHVGISGLYLAARQGLPLIGSYHTELPSYVSERMLRFLDEGYLDDAEARDYVQEVSEALTWDYLACFYNHCAKVLVPSEATRRQVEHRLRPPLELFRRGVDTTVFDPSWRGGRPADAPPRVLYVGRLAFEKNLGWLIRFGQAHPEVELEIVGDGPLRGDLERALPGARLPGFLHGEALSRAYAEADLFAFPSLTETFGNVVLEAQAAGLPAVVTNQGGPAEIVEHGRTGLVCASEAEFVGALGQLLADPARRRQMGQAARQRAELSSWPEVFDGLLEQYQSIRYPRRRVVFKRVVRRLQESEHPVAAGAVAFWKQFGRNRARREAAQNPLPSHVMRRLNVESGL